MDQAKAARLLREWISFNDMDSPDGWETPDEKSVWPFVKNTTRALEYAIGLLNNESLSMDVNHEQAIDLISAWPKYNGMDNPDGWEKEDYPFIQDCMAAMEFTADYLKSIP